MEWSDYTNAYSFNPFDSTKKPQHDSYCPRFAVIPLSVFSQLVDGSFGSQTRKRQRSTLTQFDVHFLVPRCHVPSWPPTGIFHFVGGKNNKPWYGRWIAVKRHSITEAKTLVTIGIKLTLRWLHAPRVLFLKMDTIIDSLHGNGIHSSFQISRCRGVGAFSKVSLSLKKKGNSPGSADLPLFKSRMLHPIFPIPLERVKWHLTGKFE